jgi:predicted ATPase/transcriptional regulator with XRE-family HTH domain
MDSHASFGYWVRRRRKALDLTQAELAQQVGCAETTIRKIEADERRPSRQVAARLADRLEIAAAERTAFIKAARAQLSVGRLGDPTAQTALASEREQTSPFNNLPAQATPLIGREREVAVVTGVLNRPDVRLLTLTGAGGIGKTRLALQVASALLNDSTLDVCFVALASISDPRLVVTSIAQALGLREMGSQPLFERLKHELRDKHLLLLLDNFEHVLPAAPLVADILGAAPHVKVLVTSRAMLHLYGEHEFVVPPLALPPQTSPSAPTPESGDGGTERLTQYEAVRLFVERAQAVKMDFAVTNENAPAVVEICHRLDGLPLAIELAAARSKLLAPPALLARLSNRLQLLTSGARDLPARQQTLRQTLDWSYTLLSASQQTLFRRLGAFVGGSTVEAIAAVCSADGALLLKVFDRVAALVDHSLLRQEIGVGGASRYTMLETIREYAVERLEAIGEAGTVRWRHADYYLALAEKARAEQWAGQATEKAVADWYAQEHANLLAALAWSQVTEKTELVVRLAAVLWWFWRMRASVHHVQGWVRDILLQTPAVEASALRAQRLMLASQLVEDVGQAHALVEESLTLFRAVGDRTGIALALLSLGERTMQAGELSRAAGYLEQSLALLRDAGNTWDAALVLHRLGDIARDQGDYPRAEAMLSESLALKRAVGTNWGMADVLNGMGDLALYEGDVTRARGLYHEAVALLRDLDERYILPWALRGLGRALHAQGEDAQATALIAESLDLFRDQGRIYGIGCCLDVLAGVAGTQGQPERAARVFGAAQGLRRRESTLPWPVGARVDYERDLATVHAQLDDAAFATAWATGQAMTLEQAIADAFVQGDGGIR